MALRKIMVASDFSDASRVALRRAQLIATAQEAELLLLHAIDAGTPAPTLGDPAAAEVVAADRSAIGILLEAERRELTGRGLAAAQLRLDGPPGKVVPQTAAALAADLLIVGSHGRTGLERVVLGSVAEKILRASTVPVLVARGPAEAFRRILVATDFGEEAERALQLALELAEPGAEVDVVHFAAIAPLVAVPVHPFLGTEATRITAHALSLGRELVARHPRPGVAVDFTCEIGDARLGALERVRARGHDLVAVGSHGRSGLGRSLLGSVSEGIVRHAPCSVLVTR